MPKITINNINLFYESQGHGFPLILIAGFSADATCWKTIVEPLAAHYQVITVDNRGAGQSDIPETKYSIDDMADDIHALCQSLHINEAYFLGNSMGGFITQSLALRYPALVKKAILSNSALQLQTPYTTFMNALYDLLQTDTPPVPLIKANLSWLYSNDFLQQPGILDNLIQIIMQNPYPFTLAGFKGQSLAAAAFDSSAWANQISTPTLIIGSQDDLVFNQACFDALCAQLPMAESYLFDTGGHLPHIEKPKQFTRCVIDFLESS